MQFELDYIDSYTSSPISEVKEIHHKDDMQFNLQNTKQIQENKSNT